MSNARRLIDPIAREAKKLGFVARSALKLSELDAKFSLLRGKSRILDLGCAPGAWIQVAHRASKDTFVVGVDLKEVDVSGMRYVDPARVKTLVRDVREVSARELGGARSFDVVLSDMMANTRGVSSVDALASLDLAECAMNLALGDDDESGVLRYGGDLVVKVLEGEGSLETLTRTAKPHFIKVNWFKPKATRSESRETYLVARGRKSAR
jgi:23S rRNA (uridine2552-2'-O)-methyltransferase